MSSGKMRLYYTEEELKQLRTRELSDILIELYFILQSSTYKKKVDKKAPLLEYYNLVAYWFNQRIGTGAVRYHTL